MSKRYLTKEEKRNFTTWNREYRNGTLLTSEAIHDICTKYQNDPKKIGDYILSINSKNSSCNADPNPAEFDSELDDIPYV